MRRIESRIIRLPHFEDPEGATVTERDLLSLNYAQRVAAPHLDDLVKSFEAAIKDRGKEEAIKEKGFDQNGVILETFSRIYPIEDFKYSINMHRHPGKPGLKSVLDGLAGILKDVKSKNFNGIPKQEVTKDAGEAYIAVSYLLGRIERLQQLLEPTTKVNLEHLDKEGTKLVLDKEIDSMLVYLSKSRYKVLNSTNANDVYNALSLRGRIKAFTKAVEERAFEQYVPADGKISGDGFNFDFEDGSSALILPYHRTTTSYEPVLSGLVGKKTEDIAASTGDLTIMYELGFGAQYEKAGRGSIIVATNVPKGRKKKATVTIIRGSEKREYFTVDRNGKLYVRVSDVLGTIETLTRIHTTIKPDVKIDFFPATPLYLR